MKKIRVGVIGTGAFAETCHVPGLQSHPQAEVIVLCGRNYARTHEMAQRLNVPEVTTDFEELCARTDIDAVTFTPIGTTDAPLAGVRAVTLGPV